MTFVCYYECDGCGKRVDGDLTPPGWDFECGDYCKDCKAQNKKEAPRE